MSSLANILVIDDDETMRDWCEQIHSEGGNKVETAEGGLRGLSILKKESFSAVSM